MADNQFKMSEEDLHEFLMEEGDDQRPSGSATDSPLPVMPAELEAEEQQASQKVDQAAQLQSEVEELPGYLHIKNERHRRFFEEYKKNGFNGTKAWQSVCPGSPDDSAAVQASKLLKRYGINRPRQQDVMMKVPGVTPPKQAKPKAIDTVTPTAHGKVYSACKDAAEGFMTMRDLRRVLEAIARYDNNANAQVQASKVLMEYAFRARELAQTKTMSGVAIEDVLAKSLAQVPEDVYQKALERAAAMRAEFKARCDEKFTEERVIQITAEARADMIKTGVVEQFDFNKDEHTL